jgi:hypothetical protein
MLGGGRAFLLVELVDVRFQFGDADGERTTGEGQGQGVGRGLAKQLAAQLEGGAAQEGGLARPRVAHDDEARVAQGLFQAHGFAGLGRALRAVRVESGEGDVQVVDGKAMGPSAADLEAADIDPGGLLAEPRKVYGWIRLGAGRGLRGGPAIAVAVLPVVERGQHGGFEVFVIGEGGAESEGVQPGLELPELGEVPGDLIGRHALFQAVGLAELGGPGGPFIDEEHQNFPLQFPGLPALEPSDALGPFGLRAGLIRRHPAVAVRDDDHDHVALGHLGHAGLVGRARALRIEILHHDRLEAGLQSGFERGLAAAFQVFAGGREEDFRHKMRRIILCRGREGTQALAVEDLAFDVGPEFVQQIPADLHEHAKTAPLENFDGTLHVGGAPGGGDGICAEDSRGHGERDFPATVRATAHKGGADRVFGALPETLIRGREVAGVLMVQRGDSRHDEFTGHELAVLRTEALSERIEPAAPIAGEVAGLVKERSGHRFDESLQANQFL